jgi:hypothetical protein
LQANQFRLKSAECLRQAEMARYPEARETFQELAVNYQKLAIHAESVNRLETLAAAQEST